MKVETIPVPIESPNTMTYVERYHYSLKRAYAIIKGEARGLSNKEILQYAIKSLNDSVGPDGLVPTLLVYGALPPPVLPPTNLHRESMTVLPLSEREQRRCHDSSPNCMCATLRDLSIEPIFCIFTRRLSAHKYLSTVPNPNLGKALSRSIMLMVKHAPYNVQVVKRRFAR